MTIDKAVILAAGRGSRISKLGTTPKPLLPLDGRPGGETFLDWHLDRLAEAGVSEVYLVGNRRTVDTPLRPRRATTVRWILNPVDDLSTSGSGHSAWYAWESEHGILDRSSRVAMMDADILYEPSVLDALDAPTGTGMSRTLVCSQYDESDEEVMVFGEGRRAVVHGKGLLGTGLTRHLSCFGEATGMVLFEPEDHALVREATAWCMRFSSAKERSEHEDITQRMMTVGRVEVVCFQDLLFAECDTPEEYEHLTGTLYPRARAKLRRTA
jgi:choline kinase